MPVIFKKHLRNPVSRVVRAIGECGWSRPWTPRKLWPNGINSPCMWSSPRLLTAEWADSAGTTPVATPGTVADASNPVGLALDIRAGNPPPLGAELVTNGDFSNGATGWTVDSGWEVSGGQASASGITTPEVYLTAPLVSVVVGKRYALSITVLAVTGGYAQCYAWGGADNVAALFNIASPGTYTTFFTATTTEATPYYAAKNVGYVSVGTVSVREIPGLDMLQSTSAARPLMSARGNLLTYTEDFVSFGWRNFNSGMTITTGQTDPDGGTTAVLLTATAALNWHGFDALNYFSSIGDNTFRVCIKPNGLRYFFAATGSLQVSELNERGVCFDLTGAGSVVRLGTLSTSATIELDASGYYIITINSSQSSGGIAYGASNSTTWDEFTGDGTSGFYFAFPDLRVTGSADTLPLYQSVPGDGSTYATAFPTYQKYDGTDDGMATAAFAAGTLINGMDCMIPVRRNVDLRMIIGLYKDALGSGWFGLSDATIPAPCYDSCGTPTVWVDNVQLAGGTSVNRDTLAASLTVGVWKILEFRGLDLSAWTAVQYGSYGGGFQVVGDRGDILLYPSTASTTDKDAARQYLADYYGVTLP